MCIRDRGWWPDCVKIHCSIRKFIILKIFDRYILVVFQGEGESERGLCVELWLFGGVSDGVWVTVLLLGHNVYSVYIRSVFDFVKEHSVLGKYLQNLYSSRWIVIIGLYSWFFRLQGEEVLCLGWLGQKSYQYCLFFVMSAILDTVHTLGVLKSVYMIESLCNFLVIQSVSYTHLDVYKRQVFCCIMII